jgi:PAS domain S-box-containing protein
MTANKKLRKEITERNRAEKKVRKSEEKYRNILESIEEGYYEFDTAGNLKFYNDGFKKIVGYDKNELKEINYRVLTEKSNITEILKAFNHVYSSHKSYKNIEWPIIRKDGAKRFLETSISLLKSEEGLPIGFQGIIRDVTDRNLAEASLIEAYQELKHTQSQLIQSGKLASIGELASGVAHELNQPLMVIRGNAQIIQKNIENERLKFEDIEKQVEPIVRNTKRMMNIINHLRTFSRQSKAEFYQLNINNVIEDSFLMIEEQLRLRNIRIEKSFLSNLPDIYGDSNQLEQVILNFLTNARDAITGKYCDSNHSEITDEKIEIITQISDSKENFIEIIIRDTGGGIKKEFRDNIFDPFFTTKEVGKGTGLGLSISYGIIQDHNGLIEMANSGPDGTTFKILLPISNSKSITGSGEQISMIN